MKRIRSKRNKIKRENNRHEHVIVLLEHIIKFTLFVISVLIVWRFVQLHIPCAWHMFTGFATCVVYERMFNLTIITENINEL